ncbi:MAG TPA: hypothetical protein VJ692_11400 [Nitrospiraceae bacterium]|nr:hypothetical protein [Nitrospiraceae bacterium]
MAEGKKKLDTVVKLGLGVFIGAFVLIWGGMFLTRPDRSIPPYSIGSQEGNAVAVHVPVYTSDSAIETLIYRFQKVAREGNFGHMKIQPTTPDDPAGRYRRVSIYVFTHDSWAEPEMLHRYLQAAESDTAEGRTLREAFEKAVRGFYRLEGSQEEGRIGPIYHMLNAQETAATAAYARLLFKGPVEEFSVPPASPARSPSPPPDDRASLDR